MPHRCVVGGCSNIWSLENGIGLHTIPFYGDERPEAKKRRKRWIDFVRLKLAQWEPSKICSKHFKPDDFVLSYALLKDQEAPSIPYLVRDSFGITAFPTGARPYKSGDTCNNIYKNYRPVSILPSFSKILEKAVYSRLTDYSTDLIF